MAVLSVAFRALKSNVQFFFRNFCFGSGLKQPSVHLRRGLGKVAVFSATEGHLISGLGSREFAFLR
jgi:hypothetical protein